MKKIILFVGSALLLVGILAALVLNSNYYYSKQLVQAIREEDVAKIESIIEKKPECVNTYPELWLETMWYDLINSHGESYPLNVACRTDNLEIVKLLVESGADVNCNDGYTPLATTYGPKQVNWYEISLYLIENGASLEYTTEYSGKNLSVFKDIAFPRAFMIDDRYIPESEEEVSSAFYYAVEHCDHNKVNWSRVLQDCITWDRIEPVEYLLDNNLCDVNDNSIGMTPLMFAARDSDTAMVQLLLDYGADKTIVSDDGKTAYDYAKESKNKKVADMLEE